VWDCAFSADSQYLVTGASDREHARPHARRMPHACLTRAGSSDGTGRLWSCERGEKVMEYVGHSKAVTCVSLNDNFDRPAG
jgi:WD40 repeat protein